MNDEGWQRKARRQQRLAWVMWSVLMAGHASNLFTRIAPGTATDRIMADLAISGAAFGSVLGLYFYVYAVMQLPAGALSDFLGPRKTITLGCSVAGIGSIIFGLAPSLSYLYLGRFLVSLGVSVVFISILRMQVEWFAARRFATMSSYIAFIANVGALLATTPLALLVIWVGWRTSFVVIGLVIMAISLGCWLVARDRPSDLGLPSPAEIDRYKLGVMTPAPTKTLTDSIRSTGLGERLKMVAFNKYTWPPLLIGIGLGTFYPFTGAWGIPYLMQIYEMKRSVAANFILFATIGFMVGAVSIAYFSDKVMHRRRLPAIICTSAYLSVWLLLTFWNGGKPPVPALYPICFLLGFFNGLLMLMFACVKEITEPVASGLATGLVNASYFLATGILQPQFGRILDLRWEGAIVEGARVYPLQAFHSGFVLMCAVSLISLIGAFILKETRCHDIYGELGR